MEKLKTTMPIFQKLDQCLYQEYIFNPVFLSLG